MDWFRFYSDAINDRKFRRIAYETQQPVATVLGIWVIVLSIASESPVRGALLIGPLPVNENDISMAAGCNVSETFQKFCETGLVTQVDGIWCVSAWDKRQYASDVSSDRVKAYRERVKSGQNGQNPPDVTPVKRYSNVTVTPSDTDTDTDTDKILPAYAVSAPAEQPTPAPSAKAKRTAAKKPTDPNMQHPAVVAFREETNLNPNHTQAAAIAAAVPEADVEKWRDTVRRWLLAGWRSTGVDGMLERYRDGWERNGRKVNNARDYRGLRSAARDVDPATIRWGYIDGLETVGAT